MSEVVKVDSIKVRGVARKRITLRSRMELEPDAFFVEGIGPSSTAYASYMPGNVVRYLLWVKDEDGNVVFTQEDFRAPSYSGNSGIENIESGNKVDDSITIYMVIGLPIQSPAPYTCDVAESSCSLVLVNATYEHIDREAVQSHWAWGHSFGC